MFNNRNEQSESHQPNPLPRLNDQELDHFKTYPPGYRFCPTDGELIVEFLQKKVFNQPLPPTKIMDVDFYKFHPEFLAATYLDYGEKEWYFFTPRDRKYKNGLRPNRAAGGGYWKATGGDKHIRHKGVIVGRKKAFVFYMGKPPKGEKTDWLMYEFVVENAPPIRGPKINPDTKEPNMRLDGSVLCKIYKKFVTTHGEVKDKKYEYNEEIKDPAEEIGDNHEIIGDDSNSTPKFYSESPPASNGLPPFADYDQPSPDVFSLPGSSYGYQLSPAVANNYNDVLQLPPDVFAYDSYHHHNNGFSRVQAQQSTFQHQHSPYQHQHQQSPYQHQHQQSLYQHQQSPYQHPQSPCQHQQSPYQHQQSPLQHPQSPFQHQLSAGSNQPLQQQPCQNDQPFQQQPPQNNQPFRQQPPQQTRRVLPQPPPNGDQD